MELMHASEETDGKAMLLLKPSNNMPIGLLVSCKVKISDYPELSILPKYTLLRIRGVIGCVGSTTIEVRDAQLTRIPKD